MSVCNNLWKRLETPITEFRIWLNHVIVRLVHYNNDCNKDYPGNWYFNRYLILYLLVRLLIITVKVKNMMRRTLSSGKDDWLWSRDTPHTMYSDTLVYNNRQMNTKLKNNSILRGCLLFLGFQYLINTDSLF